MSERFFINPEPYCDVCGHAGDNLRSSVEVCRDCFDVACHEPIPGVIPAWLQDRLAAATSAARAEAIDECARVCDDYSDSINCYMDQRDDDVASGESKAAGKLAERIRSLDGKVKP